MDMTPIDLPIIVSQSLPRPDSGIDRLERSSSVVECLTRGQARVSVVSDKCV